MKNYKYLDLPESAPQWLKDAHADGHVGVLCRVWDSDGETEHVKRCFIVCYNGEEYITLTGEFWDHAKPIEIEPECETVKIRVQPYLGGHTKATLLAVGKEIDVFHKDRNCKTDWIGPEQEIEVCVFKKNT